VGSQEREKGREVAAAFNHARRLTRNDADAEDVVQDAALRGSRASSIFRRPCRSCRHTVSRWSVDVSIAWTDGPSPRSCIDDASI
jgi:hypothetical protein